MRDRLADKVGADAQRIRVVDGRDERHVFRRPGRELLGLRPFGVAHAAGRRALADRCRRCHLAVLEERHDLVVVADLLDIERLQAAGREHLLHREVFDVGHVVAVRLGDGADRGGIRIHRCHRDGDAGIGLALRCDVIEVRHAGAELAQRDVLDVLRPDGGEAGDGARTNGGTGKSGRAFQKPAAVDARLPGHS